MKNYDKDKSFLSNLKTEIKEDVTVDKLSGFLVKNHGLLVEAFFMGVLLLVWVNHIFPYLEDFKEVEDIKIAIAIAGFVWFSLLVFIMILPYWFKSWLFMLIEGIFFIAVKIHSRLIK